MVWSSADLPAPAVLLNQKSRCCAKRVAKGVLGRYRNDTNPPVRVAKRLQVNPVESVPPPNELPARLQKARAHLGLSQSDLAARVGAAQQTVWRWEQGVQPQPRHLARIERFLADAEQGQLIPFPLPELASREVETAELNERQAGLIDAFAARVKSGAPLTADEVALIQASFRAVGIPT